MKERPTRPWVCRCQKSFKMWQEGQQADGKDLPLGLQEGVRRTQSAVPLGER